MRIDADLLIPGRGAPVADASLVFEDGVITYAGPRLDGPAEHAAVVMPGLWDCHTHFIGMRAFDLSRMPLEPLTLRAARAAATDLRAALDAGVTSVREVGGLGVYLARAVAEGTALGPNIYAAGAVLSATGGHGDLHAFPLPWMLDYGRTEAELRLCDGPAECARAAREQLRRNAQVIKICASGGVLSEVDHPIHQQFTLAEMRAIVEVAGMAERVVAAHCHGKPGILAALEAGVRTIEHGTYLDEECAAAMREAGAILVPTRTIVTEILESRAAPPYAQLKLEALADQHALAVALAYQSGVTIAMGTDIAMTGRELPAGWGRNGRELALMAQCGMSPLDAIEAATATAPQTLGPQAPRSGLLAPGYDADLLTLDADPLADLTVLADPAHITGVWLAGRRVKPPPHRLEPQRAALPAALSGTTDLSCTADDHDGVRGRLDPVDGREMGGVDPVATGDDARGKRFGIRGRLDDDLRCQLVQPPLMHASRVGAGPGRPPSRILRSPLRSW